MNSLSSTGVDIAWLISYIAPGFLARFGYRLSAPGADRPVGEVLLLAVVMSLPLVAVADAIAPDDVRPPDLGYVAPLLLASLAIGYGAALLRGGEWMSARLARWFRYEVAPPVSSYSLMLTDLPSRGVVTIALKDGRSVTGRPAGVPHREDDPIQEICLSHPREWHGDELVPLLNTGRLIIPLSEISHVAAPSPLQER